MAKILHQFNVSAPPEKVFEIFTSPAGLDAWWTLQSAGKPELGAAYTFFFGLEYDWRAEVVKVTPGSSLTWKMTRAMDDWMPTRVGFVLKKSDENGTTVKFFHEGWQRANEHFAISTFCWGTLLDGLKKYAEKGVIIPFEQRN